MLPGLSSHSEKPSHGTNHSSWGTGLQSISPAMPQQCRNKPSYLNMVANLKPFDRKGRKGCLCKLSTKSKSQTHLHLLGCLSAFNFSNLRVPVPVSHRYGLFPLNNTCERLFNDSDQCLSGLLGVTAAHTLVGGADE